MCSRWVLTVASLMNSCRPPPGWSCRRGDQREHLQLARAERRLLGRAADLPISRPATAGESTDSPRAAARTAAEQLVARGVLEQVAGGAGLDRGQHVAVGVVRGEHQHPGRGRRARELARSPRRRPSPASAGPSARRPASSRGDQRERLGAVAGLADHLEAVVAGEHAAQPVAHDRVVVDDQQPDHARATARRHEAARALARLATRPPACRRAGHPLPHRGQPEPAVGRAAGAARRRRRARRASPRRPCRTASARPGSAGACLADVGQRLLGGPEQRRLDLRQQRPRRAGGVDLGGDPVQLRPALAPARRAPPAAGRPPAARAAAPAPSGGPRSGCRGPAAPPCRGAARVLGVLASAASSWVTMPVRPWASVSWISRASRCRSSSTPASRAWASSWACRPAFSRQRRLEPPLASASSVGPLRRSSSRARSARRPRTTLTTHDHDEDDPGRASRPARPPTCETAVTTAVARTPAQRHGARQQRRGEQVADQGEEAETRVERTTSAAISASRPTQQTPRPGAAPAQVQPAGRSSHGADEQRGHQAEVAVDGLADQQVEADRAAASSAAAADATARAARAARVHASVCRRLTPTGTASRRAPRRPRRRPPARPAGCGPGQPPAAASCSACRRRRAA